jgi:hypothetical protein
MGEARSLGVGLLYFAVATAGAAYALLKQHQTNWFVVFLKETIPVFPLIVLVLGVYCLLRTALSILKQLNGVSLARRLCFMPVTLQIHLGALDEPPSGHHQVRRRRLHHLEANCPRCRVIRLRLIDQLSKISLD